MIRPHERPCECCGAHISGLSKSEPWVCRTCIGVYRGDIPATSGTLPESVIGERVDAILAR